MTQPLLVDLNKFTVEMTFPQITEEIDDLDLFQVTENVFGSVAVTQNAISISFSSTQHESETIIFTLGEKITLFSAHGGVAKVAGGELSLECLAGTLATNSEGQITLELANGIGVLELKENQPLFAKFDVVDGVLVVAPDSRLPEWSISVFDNAEYTRARPVRLGVPVISTVPVNGPGLTATDRELLLRGDGTVNRNMYFRIISSVPIPPGVTPSLIIRLPNGLDTVGDPISVEMTRQDDLSTVTNTVYTANYLFSKEDTVKTVDGYVYFSVDLPTRVTIAVPYEFEVYTDIGTLWSFSLVEDPTIF